MLWPKRCTRSARASPHGDRGVGDGTLDPRDRHAHTAWTGLGGTRRRRGRRGRCRCHRVGHAVCIARRRCRSDVARHRRDPPGADRHPPPRAAVAAARFRSGLATRALALRGHLPLGSPLCRRRLRGVGLGPHGPDPVEPWHHDGRVLRQRARGRHDAAGRDVRPARAAGLHRPCRHGPPRRHAYVVPRRLRSPGSGGVRRVVGTDRRVGVTAGAGHRDAPLHPRVFRRPPGGAGRAGRRHRGPRPDALLRVRLGASPRPRPHGAAPTPKRSSTSA